MTTAQYEKTIKELTDKVVEGGRINCELERKNCELKNDLIGLKIRMNSQYRGVCERFRKRAKDMNLDYEEKLQWDYALIDDWVKNSNWVKSCSWKDFQPLLFIEEDATQVKRDPYWVIEDSIIGFLCDYCILDWKLMYVSKDDYEEGYCGVYRKEWTDNDGNKKVGPRIYLPDPLNE
jgi:hypothetical protein